MAEQHGGYRKPANPAPVSGPGALSQRTDGGPGGQPSRYVSGLPYGEGQEFMDLQGSAPMAATSPTQSSARGGARGGQAGSPGFTPLNAPTERPDEPLTAGSPFGPGAGPEALSVSGMQQADAEVFRRHLPALQAAAEGVNVPDSFRRFVAYIQSQVS